MDEWLASIGLSHHVPSFHAHKITLAQLGDLTEEDLRELGLTIGERRRFNREVAAAAASAFTPATGAAAEHRPLTVLFVDLIGSTELGEILEGEDFLQVITVYREFCGQAITRYGGHISRFLGDGILAYFCYPVANENDPERAVRAALDIVAGIGAIESAAPRPLQVRIGLATGRVIVGDLTAGGANDVDTVIGSVPNLAARLQSLARPNEVIVSDRTYERIGSLFICEPRGPVRIRGFGEPQPVWRVLKERTTAQVRSSQDERVASTPFVGRGAQLDVLQAHWREAERGHGSAVLILGEAGIGKSRLTSHFVRKHANEAVVVRLFGSPFDANSPLRPFADYLVEAVGLSAADDTSTATEKLCRFLSPMPDALDKATILAVLLGYSSPKGSGELRPEELRDRTVSILVEHVLARAAGQAVCLIAEDVHWLDPTTQEILDALIGKARDHSLLILATSRHDVSVDWQAQVDSTIRLGRLDPGLVADMLRGLFPLELAQSVAKLVSEKTDGVPLFVEEVARVLAHHGAKLNLGDLPERFIPSSLEETLMARLDRSRTAKEIIQAAAVVGRSTRRDILAFVCGLEGGEIDRALSSLVELGILDPSPNSRSETFTFHHALLRDAAYSSLLRDVRRDLHERTARALQALDPEGVQQYPESLAIHLAEAGLVEEATPLWIAAAKRSLARSSLDEAVQLLRRALTDLEKAPETDRVRQQRVDVSALLGPALIGTKGVAAAETQDLYTRAYDLCQALPDDPSHFPIYWGWWRISPFGTGRSETLLQRAKRWDNPDLLLEAHHCAWAVQFQRGAFHACRDHMATGLGIYECGNYAHHAPLYGNHDAKICALGNLTQLYWMEGKLKQARKADEQTLAWAKRLDHFGSTLHAMGLTLLHSVYRRDLTEVYDRSARLIALTSENGVEEQGAAGYAFQGWVVALRDDPQRGLALFEQGLARQRAIATNEDLSVYLCLLADCLSGVGRADEAVERIKRELPGLEASELWIWMPELYRMLGESVLAANPRSFEEGRKWFDRAADLAAEQQVPMLELRIALSRARLLDRQGEAGAASIVEDALATIPEPDGSSDIALAKSFLARGALAYGS